jgi:hypothetical protein
MRDDQHGPDEKVGSQDRKTRVKGDRVIHTVKGSIYAGDRYERPRGLTTEQYEDERTGAKIQRRQVREAAFEGAHGGKPPVSRLDGTDEVTETNGKSGGRRHS